MKVYSDWIWNKFEKNFAVKTGPERVHASSAGRHSFKETAVVWFGQSSTGLSVTLSPQLPIAVPAKGNALRPVETDHWTIIIRRIDLIIAMNILYGSRGLQELTKWVAKKNSTTPACVFRITENISLIRKKQRSWKDSTLLVCIRMTSFLALASRMG